MHETLHVVKGYSPKSMTALQSEQEDNFRLHNRQAHLDFCRNAENEARIALARAVEATRRAKEKHEAMFEECQNRAVARRKSGQIIVNPGY